MPLSSLALPSKTTKQHLNACHWAAWLCQTKGPAVACHAWHRDERGGARTEPHHNSWLFLLQAGGSLSLAPSVTLLSLLSLLTEWQTSYGRRLDNDLFLLCPVSVPPLSLTLSLSLSLPLYGPELGWDWYSYGLVRTTCQVASIVIAQAHIRCVSSDAADACRCGRQWRVRGEAGRKEGWKVGLLPNAAGPGGY